MRAFWLPDKARSSERPAYRFAEALPELRNGNFSIANIERIRDEQGAVIAYQVEVHH